MFLILTLRSCPGTQSDSAGKASACEGCPNQSHCATAPKGPDPGEIIIIFANNLLIYRCWGHC
jgi:hypothetical protein